MSTVKKFLNNLRNLAKLTFNETIEDEELDKIITEMMEAEGSSSSSIIIIIIIIIIPLF